MTTIATAEAKCLTRKAVVSSRPVNAVRQSVPYSVAAETYDHEQELAISLLADTDFPELTISEGSLESLSNLGRKVFGQVQQRAMEIDGVIPKLLACNSRLVSDVPARNLDVQLELLTKLCLVDAPVVMLGEVPSPVNCERWEYHRCLVDHLVVQSKIAANRLDHGLAGLQERGFAGRIRFNKSRTVAEITSGHTVTTDRILSERTVRKDEQAEKFVGWFMTKETNSCTVEKQYELETTEIHVQPRHLLLNVQEHDVRSDIARPEHVREFTNQLRDWVVAEFVLSTGHLHDYQVQYEELRRYTHTVTESSLDTQVRRRLNDRGRDRDLFFATLSVTGMIGGSLAGLLASLTIGPLAGLAIGSLAIGSCFAMATALDPAIAWGPYCLCSWLPSGMVPQQIAPKSKHLVQ